MRFAIKRCQETNHDLKQHAAALQHQTVALSETEERLTLTAAELQHRTRDLISVVGTIADNTLRTSRTFEDADTDGPSRPVQLMVEASPLTPSERRVTGPGQPDDNREPHCEGSASIKGGQAHEKGNDRCVRAICAVRCIRQGPVLCPIRSNVSVRLLYMASPARDAVTKIFASAIL
jgi:hypothetical protein